MTLPENSSQTQKKPGEIGLILAIIFASSAISGSLVFFAMQISNSSRLQTNSSQNTDITVEKIEQALNNVIAKQQQQAQQQQQKQQQVQQQVVTENIKKVMASDHIRGNKDADVSLIEYSDFECPFCKVFHTSGTGEKLLEKYGNKINWVYRHFPLSFHEPMATKEAQMSECVAELSGNEKFWEFTDWIYQTTEAGGNGLPETELVKKAVALGIAENTFLDCFRSNKYQQRIKTDIEEGSKAGVKGTPTTVVLNNKTGKAVLVSGAQSVEVFQKAIEAVL